jgi:hypothetical protein
MWRQGLLVVFGALFWVQACDGSEDEVGPGASGSSGESSTEGGEPQGAAGASTMPTMGGEGGAGAAGQGGQGGQGAWAGDASAGVGGKGDGGEAGSQGGDGGSAPTYRCRSAGTETTVTVTDDEAEAARRYDFARGIKITGDLVTSVAALGCYEGCSYLEVVDTPNLHSLAPLKAFSPFSIKLQRTGLESLDGLQGATDPGVFVLSDNADLLELSGFAATAVNTELVIDQAAQLHDLAGLATLESVGALEITDNPALTELAGLEQLRSAVTLQISGNAELVDVSALSGLTSVTGDLSIENNPHLPTCAAEQLILAIGAENIDGTVTISGNDDTASCP